MTHYPTFNRADRIHVRLKLSRIMPLFGCNLPFRKSALLPLLSPLFSFLFHNFYSIYLDKFIIFKFLLFLINLFELIQNLFNLYRKYWENLKKIVRRTFIFFIKRLDELFQDKRSKEEDFNLRTTLRKLVIVTSISLKRLMQYYT